MMASSLPGITRYGHGGTRLNGGGRNKDPLNWCTWAHQGRLWVGMPDSFLVYTYKVERCLFPDNHVWMSCPYAHRGERACCRDPSRFLYTTASCLVYEESKRQLRLAGSSVAPTTCARGLHCGYAHGIFETWMKFRTVMCDGGADYPRTIYFFAHCLAQRRREDNEMALVVFPAMPLPPAFVPRAPRPPASASSCSPSVLVIARQVDRVTQAMQQGRSMRLLTRHSDAAGASSSSSSRAAVATAAVATAPVPPPGMGTAPPCSVDPERVWHAHQFRGSSFRQPPSLGHVPPWPSLDVDGGRRSPVVTSSKEEAIMN